ncbi:hypothetical protein SKAU_G00371090 [Synaphobranchus kaupii]|uniref:Uncharacterized protein n=1 Tax=Synaphobranchus kaupii TaxID=118154 RepID=A0A9Q1IDU9_SYNKA|nr:hypothetical protein SKAU_G00371090 [Synaphobranchus kaupii]
MAAVGTHVAELTSDFSADFVTRTRAAGRSLQYIQSTGGRGFLPGEVSKAAGIPHHSHDCSPPLFRRKYFLTTFPTRPSAMSSASPAEKTPSPDLTPQKTGKPHSLSSPQLLAELLQTQARKSPRRPSPECSSPLASPPTSPISPPSTPGSPPVTPTLPLSPTLERGLSLTSPKLLSELKQSHSLRHVNPQRGLTTVFSGRGRATRGSAQGSHSDGQSPPHLLPNAHTDERRENAGCPLVANGTQQ